SSRGVAAAGEGREGVYADGEGDAETAAAEREDEGGGRGGGAAAA
ncbi:hypothetical protein V496_07852, partial [Pseudogymnoascus sp. VKM F-4515 (FW-2607)]